MISKRELKRKWFDAHRHVICAVIIIIITVFICAVIFHSLFLVITGIVTGFAFYFWGRNKLLSYIESELYDLEYNENNK